MRSAKDFIYSVLQKRAARVEDSVQHMRDWGHPNEQIEASLSKDALLAKIMSNSIEKVPFYEEIGTTIRDNIFVYR